MIKQSMGNTRHVSLDDVCYLVSTKIVKDELFQDIEVDEESEVFCSVLNVNQYEYASAIVAGRKPKNTFVLNYEDYNDENKIKYNNRLYTIYRTFVRYDGYIECHCEVKIGG
ncbi:hypothetical protein [Lysinibacillus sp. FSL K6-4013]|uniref:hypothetical protein n=1 Tax=Lysinibacillus sp. FSL K6-4013 TaxID=2921504 RepID=UPI00315998DF